MGQGPGRAGHHQRSPSHLLLTIVFNDTHSSSHPHSTAWLQAHTSILAQLLVVRNVVLSLGRCAELLDSIPISQHLHSAERTAVTETRRSRAAPRCQHNRSTTNVSQLPRRIPAGRTDLWFPREARMYFHQITSRFLPKCSSSQVFHELARHLQTRRLIAGDSLSLDEDRSFYCVIDGMVQVYAPSGKPTEFQSGSWDDEGLNGYQLMNEVGSGGTLSSLFTILSLFTEDVKISWQNDSGSQSDDEDPTPNHITIPRSRKTKRANSDVSQVDLDGHVHSTHGERTRSPSASSSSSTVHPGQPKLPTSRHQEHLTNTSLKLKQRRRVSDQIHHGTVARATEDTTLAVIPAEAFRRLTKKFPEASAHIVQGIVPVLFRR
jgi:hypothetical protein